jgi:hypothetical protein
MPKGLKRIVVCLLTAAFILTPLASSALAQDTEIYLFSREPNGFEMASDLIFVRPFAIVGLAVSSVVWVLGWPFAKLGGNTQEAKEQLIIAPYQYAFRRPLGEF